MNPQEKIFNYTECVKESETDALLLEISEVYGDIISLVSKIGENGERNYYIHEQKGDGFAYARDISHNCGTTYEQLVELIEPAD